MTPAEWLRSCAREPWWRDFGAMAIELVIMADAKSVVRTTSDALAVHMSMSRTSLRRALDTLQAAGFCVVVGSKGRGGETVITITDRRTLENTVQAVDNVAITPIARKASGQIIRAGLDKKIGIVEASIPDSPGAAQRSEMVCDFSADPGEHGHLNSTAIEAVLDIIGSSDVVESAILGRSAPISRARDLDLLRSPDLRSSDLQDLTGSREIQIQEMGPDEPATKRGKKARVDPSRIPPRAWLAADYLRGRVLHEDPAAAVGRKTWDPGMITGLRLTWANEFRLLHERDARPWDEIARVVHWLFHKQVGGAKFIVQSPDSLREKWDRIQAVRRNQSQQEKRGADGRPDPQAERSFKTLSPNNVWSDNE